jgi:branched-chain amino acid transport system permease protein
LNTRFRPLIYYAPWAVLLIAYPFIVPSNYFVALLTQILIFSMFTMALNLAVGYAGLVSLGHNAFFGAGAYTAALLAKHLSTSMWIGLATGVGFAGILAALFAIICLRTTRVNFIFITLAMGQVVWAIVFGWRSVTGGDDGMPGVGNPEIWPSIILSGPYNYYFLALIFFAVVAFIIYRCVESPFGVALVGVRENEMRMPHLGFNVWRHKFVALILSGALSGLAGVIWAYYNGFVSPRDASFELSAEALLIVILGGRGTLFGPVIGTTIVVLIKNIVAAYTERWTIVLGVVYILTILFARQGVGVMLFNLLKGRNKGS